MEQKNLEQKSSVSEPQVNQSIRTPPPVNSSSLAKKPLTIVGVLLGFLLFGVGGYYLGLSQVENVTNNQVAVPSPTPTSQVSQPTTAPQTPSEAPPVSDATSNWNIYSNTEHGFTVKYPKKVDKYLETWLHEEYGTTDFGVGFGTPSSKSGGYIWGVWVYENGDIENLIKQMGSQFSDRQESRQEITVDGVPALLVTVTTSQYEDWISKRVYIQKNGRTYTIGNGAIDLSEFESFYNSFNLTN